MMIEVPPMSLLLFLSQRDGKTEEVVLMGSRMKSPISVDFDHHAKRENFVSLLDVPGWIFAANRRRIPSRKRKRRETYSMLHLSIILRALFDLHVIITWGI